MAQSIEQAREAATKIASRISADPEFRAQVVNDPENTLVAAGLPAEAVADFLAEEKPSSEVSGYLLVDCTLTCILTSCTITSL
jgi:hypothetical protein